MWVLSSQQNLHRQHMFFLSWQKQTVLWLSLSIRFMLIDILSNGKKLFFYPKILLVDEKSCISLQSNDSWNKECLSYSMLSRKLSRKHVQSLVYTHMGFYRQQTFSQVVLKKLFFLNMWLPTEKLKVSLKLGVTISL